MPYQIPVTVTHKEMREFLVKVYEFLIDRVETTVTDDLLDPAFSRIEIVQAAKLLSAELSEFFDDWPDELKPRMIPSPSDEDEGKNED